MHSRRLLLLCAVVGAAANAATPPTLDTSPPPVVTKKKKGTKLPLVLGAATVVGAAAVPACRRAISRLIGREEPISAPKRRAAEEDKSDAAAPKKAPAPSATSDEDFRRELAAEAEKFQLTPERLAQIAELNPALEVLAPQLAAVPVFTATVGNGTSPITVPAEDGSKLAYFFTEAADAEAFLRAIRENAGQDLQANIIGVSLSDIIRAYSTDEAKTAKETFVIIPAMAEVAMARQLLKQAGKPSEPAVLGPGSGLVPVFWSESLAVQSAGGKQRKVVFFRLGDLQQMWKNLTDARAAAGELDELPSGPAVQVSDLQTLGPLLVEANKTDDVLFLPSANALRAAQTQGQAGARARSVDEVQSQAAASAPADDGDDGLSEPVAFDGEDEDDVSI